MTITQQTRRESHESILDHAETWRQTVYDAILEGGRGSAWEISVALHKPVYTIRPRLTELQKAGKIKAVGTRRCIETGRSEAVWDIADAQGELFA